MMMKTRLTSILLSTGFLTFSLLAVFIISACASNVTATQTVVESSGTALAVASPTLDVTATQGFTESLVSATPPADAQPVATSRGPELHATDPTTVSLASGQVQFVEFFRF